MNENTNLSTAELKEQQEMVKTLYRVVEGNGVFRAEKSCTNAGYHEDIQRRASSSR